MSFVENLLNKNKEWVKNTLQQDPNYFEKLSKGQSPHSLYIGCSDSRVPPEIITQQSPGDFFVHRNIANIVNVGDMNVLSVIDFAVNALKVSAIIVMGHYYCGGVKAAMDKKDEGLVENWILPIRKLLHQNRHELYKLDELSRWHRLVELNVIEQVKNITMLPIVQNAWKQGQHLSIHGWVFNIKTGIIKDLNITKREITELPPEFVIKK